jgi:hypothetical protein
MEHQLLSALVPQVIVPVLRITFFIILGLFIANFIESLNWTHRLAALARPLIKMGHLSEVTGASFSLAFFSGVSANTILAEAYDKGQMSKKELVLANLFNSLPRFFLHLPTVFFLTAPLIKLAALFYVGLTFTAALLQTVLVVMAGRILLPESTLKSADPAKTVPGSGSKRPLTRSVKRLRKRIVKIIKFMIPVYLMFFVLNWYGLFNRVEQYLAANVWFLSWLNPQALGIVVLHVTTEFSAGLAAASVLLAENSLSYKEVVLALLVGNLLSTPIRAIRHQFPYYTGIYTAHPCRSTRNRVSQLSRAFCIVIVTVGYFFLSG